MWSLLSLNKIWLSLMLSWLICGVVGCLAGFWGLFYLPLAVFLIAPLTMFTISFLFSFHKLAQLSRFEKIVVMLIGIWWLLHSLQVFVPETGFDALWYHLPLAQQTVSSHRFIGDANFYQSFNPQFSDSIFYLGFAVAGETGTKFVAFLIGLTLAFTTYLLSRVYVNRTYSLLAVLIVSSFQVISWQSSSFYVDISKAVWELSALILILKWPKMNAFAGLFFGASLASKLFSILLVPLMLIITLLNNGKKAAGIFLVLSAVVAVPFYLFAYSVSGNPFYSVFHHVGQFDTIGNSGSVISFLIQKTLTLPKGLYELIFTKEYTTPLIILFFPFLFIYRKHILKDKKLLSIVSFTLFQLAIWWYVPPTSSRYALSGFVTAVVSIIYFLSIYLKLPKQKSRLLYILLIAGFASMPIRMAVAVRSLLYLSGQQSREEYLLQFYDGNVDFVLKKWHKL